MQANFKPIDLVSAVIVLQHNNKLAIHEGKDLVGSGFALIEDNELNGICYGVLVCTLHHFLLTPSVRGLATLHDFESCLVGCQWQSSHFKWVGGVVSHTA